MNDLFGSSSTTNTLNALSSIGCNRLGDYPISTIGVNTPKIIVEDDEESTVIKVAAPGVNEEFFDIHFKDGGVYISLLEDFDFISEFSYYKSLDFPVKKKNVVTYYEDGVLFIEIVKPEDYEFSVGVG